MKQMTKQKMRQLTNKVNFVSIREQKQYQQVNKPVNPSITNYSSKQSRPHKPLSRQEPATKEIKQARLPLYHPSRFR